MKLYFAKYLPVEGEIKEGEIGISINNATYTHYDHLGKDYGKPAKLFLCSRDIQAADIVQTPLGEGKCKRVLLSPRTKEYNLIVVKFDKSLNVDDSTEVYRSDEFECYKVVGEISPEATWVKEGDEFDDSEIKPVVMVMNYTTPFEYGKYENFEDIKKMYKGAVVIVKIKCPTCKNFH